MRITGQSGSDGVERILEINREGGQILFNIHHPVHINKGEKIRLDPDEVVRVFANLERTGIADLRGRMRKEKVIRIERRQDENGDALIYFWIRVADSGPTEGWDIIVPADITRRAINQEVRRTARGLNATAPNN
jgi:hypothetical protein